MGFLHNDPGVSLLDWKYYQQCSFEEVSNNYGKFKNSLDGKSGTGTETKIHTIQGN